mgnify:CR=1 FL=1
MVGGVTPILAGFCPRWLGRELGHGRGLRLAMAPKACESAHPSSPQEEGRQMRVCTHISQSTRRSSLMGVTR